MFKFRIIRLLGIMFVLLCLFSRQSAAQTCISSTYLESLRSQLLQIANNANGTVGIAVISPDGDSITINNNNHYPLMSVFKLHQALAVAHTLDSLEISFDTLIRVNRKQLDHKTWSPMLKDLPDADTLISIHKLLSYSLQYSDNNASNLLFEHIVSVARTDRFIRDYVGINGFQLRYSESEMKENHALSQDNWSYPMDCAMLIKRLFTDKIVSTDKQQTIATLIQNTGTEKDRLSFPLKNQTDARIAHKTGSGYRTENGLLMAHNDIGYITLPNGRQYAIAVLITDFKGTEQEASSVIAQISTLVYNTFCRVPI